MQGITLNQALRMDDNDYPKHLWAFIFTGKKFKKQGPEDHQLAHLVGHKQFKDAIDQPVVLKGGENAIQPLDGLYTSAANTIYVPTSLVKPTDFSWKVKNVLLRRAHQLYGTFCRILPPWLEIRRSEETRWRLDEFPWAEPVGGMEHMGSFLNFRHDTINEMLEAK